MNEALLLFSGTGEAPISLDNLVCGFNSFFNRAHVKRAPLDMPRIKKLIGVDLLQVPDYDLVRGTQLRAYILDLGQLVQDGLGERYAFDIFNSEFGGFLRKTKLEALKKLDYENSLQGLVEAKDDAQAQRKIAEEQARIRNLRGDISKREEEVRGCIQGFYNLVAEVKPPKYTFSYSKSE